MVKYAILALLLKRLGKSEIDVKNLIFNVKSHHFQGKGLDLHNLILYLALSSYHDCKNKFGC